MSAQPHAAVLAAEIERPALRGTLHLAAAVLALFGAAWLVLVAGSPTGYVGGAVFGVSLILLYGTSATYHNFRWRPSWRRNIRRVDHAMIFVLIAGTYTPFSLDISLAWGIPVLAVVWSLAGAGALLKVLWPEAPRWFDVSLYIGLGWVGVVAASQVFAQYMGSPLALIFAGGALYTIGGIVYARRRPDPWPRIFGYHEVFHALIVAGSAVHYALVITYIV